MGRSHRKFVGTVPPVSSKSLLVVVSFEMGRCNREESCSSRILSKYQWHRFIIKRRATFMEVVNMHAQKAHVMSTLHISFYFATLLISVGASCIIFVACLSVNILLKGIYSLKFKLIDRRMITSALRA